MECSRFLEEKISGGGGPEFRDHLAACEACRRDVEEYEEILRLYREASTESYPGRVPRFRRFGAGAWLPSAAAALLLVGVLLYVLFGGTGVRPDPEPVGTTAFFRVYLSPWDRQEVRWNETVGDLWERVALLERSRR